jgi:hypothetical protein
MANNLNRNEAKQKTYLSGYFALLLIAISGLVLQGGGFALVGLSCWGFTLLGFLYCFFRRSNASCIRIKSFHAERYPNEEESKSYVHS